MTEPKAVALQVQRNGRRITDARLGRPPNPPRVSFSGGGVGPQNASQRQVGFVAGNCAIASDLGADWGFMRDVDVW
jgi:hypothetical protein